MSMTITKAIQEHINEIANNADLKASASEALKLEGEMIAELETKIANGKTEKTTAQKAVADLKDVNAQLQNAIHASTPGT